MSIGKRLTEKEQGKIEALRAEDLSNREIAKKIKRSPKVVNNYLKLKDKYGLKGNRGRKSKVMSVLKKIIHHACKNLSSMVQTKSDLQLDICARTVQRVMRSSPTVIYWKFKSKPILTAAHRESCISDLRDWSKII